MLVIKKHIEVCVKRAIDHSVAVDKRSGLIRNTSTLLVHGIFLTS